MALQLAFQIEFLYRCYENKHFERLHYSLCLKNHDLKLATSSLQDFQTSYAFENQSELKHLGFHYQRQRISPKIQNNRLKPPL